MKKYILSFSLLLASVIFILISGCGKTTTVEPCENKGNVCIVNKLDTVLTVSIESVHQTFIIHKDYMECTDLTGNQPYTLTITSLDYNIDTTFMLLPCDKKLITIQK
jgi:hypothetical protein